MGHLVGLARAVRVLGISRGEVQRLIHDGELNAPDGMVDIDKLRQLYPGLALNESRLVERIQLLKTTAFSRRVRSTVAPEKDILEIQLNKRNAELSVERALAKKYRELVEEVARKLCEMQDSDDPAQRRVVAEINRWLLLKLER